MLDDGMENSGQVNSGDISLMGGKGRDLLDEMVLANAPKKKKKKNKNKDSGSDISEAMMALESGAGSELGVQGGDSGTSVEIKKKKKKKKGQLVITESDSGDGGKRKVLHDEMVLDNAPKKKKKKNKDNIGELSAAITELDSRAAVEMEVEEGESSSSVERKKKKKKEGQVVITESEVLLDTERTSEEVKHKECTTTSDTFCVPNSDSSQTKKKKKKKKSKNTNEDDAPESVDSGCVVDSSVESLETTDWDQASLALKSEYLFMSRLLAWIPKPTEIDPDDVLAPTVVNEKKRKAVHFEDEEEEEMEGRKIWKKKKKGEMAKEGNFKKQLKEGHELVQNYEELKKRWMEKLASLRGKKKKAAINPAERREEQRLKNKLKQLEDRRKQKLRKAQKKQAERGDVKKEGPDKAGANTKKPVYTNDGQLVFSKFDFSTSSKDKEGKKKKQDLNKLLSQALKEKEKVKQLVEEGNIGKANELKEKKAWKGALLRAQGEKVKDDPELLKKSLKKKEGKKKQSQKKWEQRLANEEKKKNELSQKRQNNMNARKTEKLQNKMKKMKKKGHIVPGF